MAEDPPTGHLVLFARHGSGPFERALATVSLARRRGREQELRELIEDVSPEKVTDGGTSRKTGENGSDDLGGITRSPGGPARPPNTPHEELDTSLPEVSNVVTAGSLGREIDIDVVGADIDEAEVVRGDAVYPPDRLCFRNGSRKPLLTLYQSGSYHITGARSVVTEEETLARFVDQLERNGVGGLAVTFGVKNVLARADLGRDLDLNSLLVELGPEHAEYDPEVDTGLMYRPDARTTDYRLFSTGRTLLYADSIEAVCPSFVWLSQILGIDD